MEWLSYASMFLWYASIIVVIGATGACRVFSNTASDDGSSMPWARASLRMARIMMPLMLLAVVTRLCVQTWQSFGIDQPLVAFARIILNETPWGAGWFWQMCASVAAWVVLSVMPPARWPALVAAAVATGLTVGLTGHAAGATEYRAWLQAAHGVHVVAAGLWLGTLGVVIAVTWGTGTTAAERSAFARAIDRFSLQAIPSVAMLMVSGVVSGWQHVSDLQGLLTPYGSILLAKIVAFGGAALCGFYNWRMARPTHLRRLATLELAFGIVALGLTSILTSMPMPDHR